MASVVSIVVTARNNTAAGFNSIRTRFSQMLANMRVSWNRNLNNLISRGGLSGFARRLPGLLGNVGSQAGQFFVNNFKAIAISGIAAVAAPIAATLLSGLAAALAAGVLLAVGGGIFALGIKAAASSPAVKSAFNDFKDRAGKAFKDLGGPFQAPLVRAMSAFAMETEKIAPSINKMVAMAAPHLDKITTGLMKMVDNVMPGFEKAFEASLPLIDKLAEKLPSIGTAIGQFFELIADSGPEAVRVLAFLIDAINFIIVALGGTINFGAKFYSTMIGFWKGVGEVAMNVWNAIKNAATATWNWITSAATSAWNGITSAFQAAKSTIISAFGALTSAILGFVGMIINAAAKAFGWVPGIGPKLQQAAAEFNNFAARVNAAINGIQKTVTITVHARLIGGSILSAAQQSGSYSSGVGGRASGGIASRLTKVGEHGTELVDFSQGRVYNKGQSDRMMAGSGGPVQVNITVAADPGSAKDSQVQATLKMIRDGDIRLRVQGNRVVTA